MGINNIIILSKAEKKGKEAGLRKSPRFIQQSSPQTPMSPVGQKRLTFDSKTPDGGKVPPTKHKKNAQVTYFGDMKMPHFSLGIKSPKKGKDTPKKSKKKLRGTPLRVSGTATSTTSATSLVFLGEIEEPGVHEILKENYPFKDWHFCVILDNPPASYDFDTKEWTFEKSLFAGGWVFYRQA